MRYFVRIVFTTRINARQTNSQAWESWQIPITNDWFLWGFKCISLTHDEINECGETTNSHSLIFTSESIHSAKVHWKHTDKSIENTLTYGLEHCTRAQLRATNNISRKPEIWDIKYTFKDDRSRIPKINGITNFSRLHKSSAMRSGYYRAVVFDL